MKKQTIKQKLILIFQNSYMYEIYKNLKITPLWENKWELLEDYKKNINFWWTDFTIKIPKWFIFDGASIPRLFSIIWTPMSTDTLIPALIHDYLYRVQTTSRSFADMFFFQMMRETWVGLIKSMMFYIWVRIWWWIAWIKNKT